MLHDIYEAELYNCPSCDHKDHLLREAGLAMTCLLDSYSELRKTNSRIEERLLSNMEDVCHMLGIEFKE